MTAILRNYSAVVVGSAGSEVSFGKLNSPVGESTIDGDEIDPSRLMSVGAGDYVVLWQQEHGRLQFQQVGFRIIGDGSLIAFWRTDLPTSETNFTPLGTRKRWFNKAFGCKGPPWWFWDQTDLGIASLTDQVADDGGLPKLMTSLIDTAATGIVDKIVLYNPGTAAVKIERFLAQ